MKNSLKDNFVPKEIANVLKSFGFEETCFGFYSENDVVVGNFPSDGDNSAILYQQAHSWFREKFNLNFFPTMDMNKWMFTYGNYNSERYETYTLANNACLEKKIEIVKNNNLQ